MKSTPNAYQIGLACLFCILTTSVGYSDEIRPVKKWDGRQKEDRLRDACPKNRVIVSAAQFLKVWQVWMPTRGRVPHVNFKKSIIVVAIADGPNKIMAPKFELDAMGDLNFKFGSTRRAGPGFGFCMYQLPRMEIRTVNGLSIEEQPNLPPAESVKVDITGVLNTAVAAIGGETTGAVITADRITLELDFQGNQALISKAHQMSDGNGAMARVTGRLTQKQGVEIGHRWIVLVESLDDGNQLPADNAATSFKTIKIVQSGGIAGINNEQLIDPQGAVVVTKIKQRITENYDLDRDVVNQLHKLIGSTDWSKIPESKTNPRIRDSFHYEFLIDTGQQKFRFAYDGISMEQQPALKQLVQLSTPRQR